MTEKQKLIIAAILAMSVYIPIHFFTFKGTVPYFQKITQGQTIFDRSVPVSQEELYQRIEAYGEAGRKEYVFRNLTADFILPFALLPLMLLGVARLNRHLNIGSIGRIFLVLPIAFVMLDLVENFSVIWLVFTFPEQQPFLAGLLPVVTIVKRMAVGSTLVFLAGGFFWISARTYTRLRRAST